MSTYHTQVCLSALVESISLAIFRQEQVFFIFYNRLLSQTAALERQHILHVENTF